VLHQGEYEQIHTLDLDVSYKSLLQVEQTEQVARGLTDARLGRDFAVRAVHVLSSHPVRLAGINMSVGKALAGLIFMICESARMNPLHDACARGWTGDMPMASIIYGVVTCSVYVVSGGVHASCGGGSIIILLQTTPNYCPAAFRGCKTRYLL